MRKYTFLLIALIGFIFTYCSSPEDKALKVVDNFLSQANDEIEGNLDTTKITQQINDLIKIYSGFASKDGWTLSVNEKNDSVIIVESVGKSYNALGQPIKIKQKFKLKQVNNEWIIYDTYNVIRLFLAMDIVDRDWDFFWDIEKFEIMKHLKDNLKLEVIEKGHQTYFGDSAEGKIRLTNDSEYDIRNVNVLIEHYDRDGRSVNTDTEYVLDIIRKNGYREFDWYTNDCSNCYEQKFEIKYQSEY